ncbi:MAG: hypothetical protein H6Q68_1815 [Firmicutes bacterium]|nr:hypothetical protein [Bacillota bacterium]
MRKYIASERGVTLLELMIGMTVTVILLSGMLSLFGASLAIWTVEKSRTIMQQTARLTVDKIMREIRYGKELSLNNTHSLRVTKLSGEINTFQLGEGLHGSTLYIIIDKTKVIPAGGYSTNPITENVVTNLLFIPYPEMSNIQAIGITLEVTDPSTGQKQTIHTAGFPWNRR